MKFRRMFLALLASLALTVSGLATIAPAAYGAVVVTGYNVYRGSTLVTTVSGTSYTDTGRAANTSYTYTVRARDAAGNLSGTSNTVTARTSEGGGPDPNPSRMPGAPYLWMGWGSPPNPGAVINAVGPAVVDFDIENTDEFENYTVQDRLLGRQP